MKVDRADVIRNLPKKGFRKDKFPDHIYFYHELEGKETGPWTKVSHSKKRKDIDRELLGAMRKQLRLDRNHQVVELVECPMDGSGFNALMREKGTF